MAKHFSISQISEAFDIPVGVLRTWVNDGFISPTKPATGRGKKALFTLKGVYGVILFRNLFDRGLSRSAASGLVNAFLTKDDVPEIIKYIIFMWTKKKGSEPDFIIIPIGEDTTLNTPSDAFNLQIVFSRMIDDWTEIMTINFREIRKLVHERLKVNL